MLEKIPLCIDHQSSTQSLTGEVWGCYRGAVEDACLLGWHRVKWLIATKFRTRVVLPSSSPFEHFAQKVTTKEGTNLRARPQWISYRAHSFTSGCKQLSELIYTCKQYAPPKWQYLHTNYIASCKLLKTSWCFKWPISETVPHTASFFF
jgi:hypothetical protein